MPKMTTGFAGSGVIKRYNGGAPVLTKDDVPYRASLVFNAGVVKFCGKYVMIFRDDYGLSPQGNEEDCGTRLGLAVSTDGLKWTVSPDTFWDASAFPGHGIKRVYDPRLTVIDGRCCMCFAADTAHGLRGGMAVTDDLKSFELISLTVPDNRNMVLFPEKVGGRYVRLERPFPMYSRGRQDRFDTWISCSPDLRYWGDSSLLFAVEDVPFANNKVGPGAPPVKTERGWLTLFHAVQLDPTRGKNGWEDVWQKCYMTGIMLLDSDDPGRIVGMCKTPLMVPETKWETDDGYRTNVIFPGGMILEDSGEVKIYYGASDTVECLATADVNDLIRLCLEGK